jgi:putative flippase GtrA
MRSARLISTLRSWGSLIRYYQAAVVNTLFGYSLYALFVAAGMNMYVAQLVGHVLGVIFNYFTYSRHAFRGAEGSKIRFAAAYAGNYLVGLITLAAVSTVIPSPFVAGFVALIVASLVNYFVLRNLVFVRTAAGAGS